MFGSGQDTSSWSWSGIFTYLPDICRKWEFVRWGCGWVLVRAQADSGSDEIGYSTHTHHPEVAEGGEVLCSVSLAKDHIPLSCCGSSSSWRIVSAWSPAPSSHSCLRKTGTKEWGTLRYFFRTRWRGCLCHFLPHPIGQHLVTLGGGRLRAQVLESDGWGSHSSSVTCTSYLTSQFLHL